MSALARAGHRETRAGERAFEQAVAHLQLNGQRVVVQDVEQYTLSRVESVLRELATCSMPIEKRVLGATVLCVAADGKVTVAEAELLRAIADAIDRPMPPVIPCRVRHPESAGHSGLP